MSSFYQCFKSKKLVYGYSSQEPFFYTGIILLASKIKGKIPEEKDCLKRIASWSNLFLFSRFRVLVRILFGLSLLFSNTEGITLNTKHCTRQSIWIIKNSILTIGEVIQVFFLRESDGRLNISKEFSMLEGYPNGIKFRRCFILRVFNLAISVKIWNESLTEYQFFYFN